MKKILAWTVFLIAFLPNISGQSIKGGLIAGFNMCQVDGDEVYGFHKYGLNVGLTGMLPVKKKFDFCLETLYNQKGSFQRPTSYDSLNGSYKLKLHYLDVPVLITYTDKDAFTVGAGFSWGRLVQFGEWEHGYKVNWDTKFGPYKNTDIDFLFDVRFRIAKGIKLNARYSYSVAKLRTRTFLTGEVRKQFNNFISVRLIWMIGEKDDKTKKKEEKK